MNKSILFALFVSTASVASAQDTLTSASGSNANANSGSVSGASVDGNLVGNSESTSNSNAGAISGSTSTSGSVSDQTQGQGQGQDQGQGQSQGQNANNSQGQMQGQDQTATQGNAQSTSITFEGNKQRRTTEFRTNNAVPLAASSSFSSDYCGGTVSGGGSFAPLGISLGGAAPKFDKSCQALRRAEKFGMAAANAHNMSQPALAQQLMSMMIWSICTADSAGPSPERSTAQACAASGLLGGTPMNRSAASPPSPVPSKAPEAKVALNGQITPVAASRAQDDQRVAATVPR